MLIEAHHRINTVRTKLMCFHLFQSDVDRLFLKALYYIYINLKAKINSLTYCVQIGSVLSEI